MNVSEESVSARHQDSVGARRRRWPEVARDGGGLPISRSGDGLGCGPGERVCELLSSAFVIM